MILLRKKISENEYFDFDKILMSGYHIREDRDRITQKFINGNRKQFISEYTDVEITVDLGTFDLETTVEYLENLTDGEYQYFSLETGDYKSCMMIIEEKPEQVIDNAFENNNVYIADFSVKLLRAGEVENA